MVLLWPDHEQLVQVKAAAFKVQLIQLHAGYS